MEYPSQILGGQPKPILQNYALGGVLAAEDGGLSEPEYPSQIFDQGLRTLQCVSDTSLRLTTERPRTLRVLVAATN